MKRGFTLMEVLIVVAMIAVLVAISIPVFSSQLERARAATDAANVRSAKASAAVEYLLNETAGSYYFDAAGGTVTTDAAASIAGYGKSQKDVDLDGAEGIPNENGTANIVCVTVAADGTMTAKWVASGSGGGSGGSTTYPGTTLTIHQNYWPSQEEFPNTYDTKTIKAGGIFLYTDGEYYIVVKDTTVTKDQAAPGPGGTVYGWYATEKITGRVIMNWTDSSQKSDLKRGDIAVGTDGKYYVYIDGGSWAYAPDKSPSQWYQIPS